jgi:hypothetical protein
VRKKREWYGFARPTSLTVSSVKSLITASAGSSGYFTKTSALDLSATHILLAFL